MVNQIIFNFELDLLMFPSFEAFTVSLSVNVSTFYYSGVLPQNSVGQI